MRAATCHALRVATCHASLPSSSAFLPSSAAASPRASSSAAALTPELFLILPALINGSFLASIFNLPVLACDLCNVSLAEVTVEGRGTINHGPHVCDLCDVPLAEVTVEGRGTTKHRRHVCDLCNVPLAEAVVTVEAPLNMHVMSVTLRRFTC